MEVEKLELGQHINCMYATSKGWKCVNGTIYKITPKTFAVNVRTKLVTIKKANVMTLKIFDGQL